MTLRLVSNLLRFTVFTLLAGGILCDPLFAQGPLPDAPTPIGKSSSLLTIEPAPILLVPSRTEVRHRFWDKENMALFGATAALNGADFAVTRANLQNGGQELNPMVRIFGRSTPALAMNFVGETAGVVSISYFFHKTGHHKLERAVSMLNLAGSAGAVTYGMTHR